MESNETAVLSNAVRQAKFKQNKAFRSLPLDVQRKIDNISDSDEERSRRVSVAIHYQEHVREGSQVMAKRPTIDELQRMLDDPNDHPIEVQPDGSIKVDRRKKGQGIVTKRQSLGDSY